MKLEKNTRFLIVGLGLLGGSYAKALKKQGYTVEAITRSQSSIDYGLENGIIDGGAAFPDPEIIGRADFVVLAMYPQTLLDWVEQNQRYFKPGALITDVTGVKTCVVEPVQAMLRQDVEFIAAHPMAGRETLGGQNADESIFPGAHYIVTPTAKHTPGLCPHLLPFSGGTRPDDRLRFPADPCHRRQPDDLQRHRGAGKVHRRLLPGSDPHRKDQRRDVERAVSG